MNQYLVELYVPRTTGAAEAAALAVRAADGVTYVRTIFVPEDETCFHQFESVDAHAVREALRRAAIGYQRILEAEVR